MKRKILNLWEFFKSTLVVNLSLSCVFILFGGIATFTYVFLSLGFIVSIAVKEIHQKNNYFFYYNNGLTKVQLWIFSYVFTVLGIILLAIIHKIIINYFG